ncbi:hypothetical protein SUGI_0697720 [Cryptomeria japonica]|nr:hypothetical protein SUGI_0697720 [Cryptomeria japonica]
MKPVCAFSVLVVFWFLMSSFGLAARPIPDVMVLSYKPTTEKGVIELKIEVSVRLDLDEKLKSIKPANSGLIYGNDDNSKKVKVLPSPITMSKMVRKLEEESGTVEPRGHSPGIGHNNPPGNKALDP